MDKDISFVAFESICARLERTIRRLWVLVILLIILLAGSNCAWLYYESQFEDVTTTETYEADAEDGGTAIVNGSGVIDNG